MARSKQYQTGSGANSTLEQLWIDAGGPANVAAIMAAIGMAESGGQNVVQQGQPYATTGWGIWQITPGDSVPSIGVNNALLDPLTNAKAAVAKYRSQGLGAWTTYTSGAYLAFLSQAGSATYGKGNSSTRPGGQAQGQPATSMDAILTDWYTAQAASGGTQQPQLSGALDMSTTAQDMSFLGIPFLPNPIDLFKGIVSGVNDTVSFFKLLAWIINPVNILRMVEFLVGLGMMVFGIQAAMQARGERIEGFTTSEGALSRSGLGRVARELGAAVAPESRAVSAVRSRRPSTAPHKTRRIALRTRYEREQQVSRRKTEARRSGR